MRSLEADLSETQAATASSQGARHRMKGYENRLVAILALAGGVAALDAQAVFYLMPFIAVDLHLDNTRIGIISSAVLISWSLAALLVARLSDRVGRRKPFLIGSFLLFALLSTMSAYAGTFAVMFAARLLIGVAEGPVIPMQQAIMLAESSPHRRGLNMGIVQNFGAQLIGSMLAPLFLVWLATHYDWHSAFLVAGGPGLLVAALIAWLVREPIASVRPQAHEGPSWALLLADRNIRLCILIGTASVAWFFLLLSFLPLWSIQKLGLTPAEMSVVMGAIGAAGASSAILVPGLSDRIGRRRAIAGFALVGAIAPIGALLVGPHPVLLCIAMLLGCQMLGTFPLFMGAVPLESVPARHAASASALVIAISQIAGGVCGPLIGGVMADRFGLATPLYASIALALLAAVLATRLNETAGTRQKNGQMEGDKP